MNVLLQLVSKEQGEVEILGEKRLKTEAIGGVLAQTHDTNTVNVLGNIVFLLAIVSGLWFPFKTLSHWIQIIGGHTPVYYIAEIARELVSGKIITWSYLIGMIIWSLLLGGLIYLIQAIRTVTNGQTVYESRLVKGMFDKSKCPLNKRELQILNVMKEFSNTKQIAKAVFLAEETVRNYISAILSKTGTSSRLEAVLLAKENRWI